MEIWNTLWLHLESRSPCTLFLWSETGTVNLWGELSYEHSSLWSSLRYIHTPWQGILSLDPCCSQQQQFTRLESEAFFLLEGGFIHRLALESQSKDYALVDWGMGWMLKQDFILALPHCSSGPFCLWNGTPKHGPSQAGTSGLMSISHTSLWSILWGMEGLGSSTSRDLPL